MSELEAGALVGGLVLAIMAWIIWERRRFNVEIERYQVQRRQQWDRRRP